MLGSRRLQNDAGSRMKIGLRWGNTSGFSLGDCALLGYRYNARRGWSAEYGQAYVLELRAGQVHIIGRHMGWPTGVWRSPSGKTYVAAFEALKVHPGGGAPIAAWRVEKVDAFLSGVWGLREDCLFVWGKSHDGREIVRHWNGRNWSESVVPNGVVAIHGVSEALIYAVGRSGFIARWDGHGWKQIPLELDATLTSLCVVSRDEMYATANVVPKGILLEGSYDGWVQRSALPTTQIYSVAKLGSVVHLGSSVGLLTLQGNNLVPAAPPLTDAIWLETRAGLLVTGKRSIAHTTDGDSFEQLSIDGFVEQTKNDPVTWPEGDFGDPTDEFDEYD